MPSWRTLSIACAASVLLAPPSLVAQAKDGFVLGVVDFINAADDGSPAARRAAVNAMADGLGQWDALLAKVEAGMAADISGAPPATAARMRTALGAAYLERGKVEAGLAQLDAAAALDGSSPEVHVFRGLALESAGRPAEAAQAYHRAWQRDTASAINAYRFLRARRQASGPPGIAAPDVAAATKTLRAAVDVASTAASTAVAPPFILLTLDLLDDGSSAAPVIPPAAYANAFALLLRGRYDDAVAGFREAVADPTAAAAAERSGAEERSRLALADAHVAAGDPTAARQVLIETLQVFPQSHRASWKLGMLLQSLGDQRGAADAFEAAASGPIVGAAPLWAAAGRLHHQRLDLDAASAAYARRAALQPNDGAGHYDLADVYRASDDLAEAMVEALAAVLLEPANARAFAMVGQLDAAAGQDDAALPMLRRAVGLAPSDGEARYALSRALLRMGRKDEAQRELEVFQQLQSKAMEAERRRFEENQTTIDRVLKGEEERAPGR
jgi:tetratricopeptide (TPR) repeat protein